MQDLYGVDDVTYAREVEMTNGRAAMLGFLVSAAALNRCRHFCLYVPLQLLQYCTAGQPTP